jgi:hypothetical protein
MTSDWASTVSYTMQPHRVKTSSKPQCSDRVYGMIEIAVDLRSVCIGRYSTGQDRSTITSATGNCLVGTSVSFAFILSWPPTHQPTAAQ